MSQTQHIEELQRALSRRNERIAELEAEIERLNKRRKQTHREARAEAWAEGERHESQFMLRFGQYCPYKNCNPYLDGEQA